MKYVLLLCSLLLVGCNKQESAVRFDNLEIVESKIMGDVVFHGDASKYTYFQIQVEGVTKSTDKNLAEPSKYVFEYFYPSSGGCFGKTSQKRDYKRLGYVGLKTPLSYYRIPEGSRRIRLVVSYYQCEDIKLDLTEADCKVFFSKWLEAEVSAPEIVPREST